MTTANYTHPNPIVFRGSQWLIFIAMWVILLTIPLQIMIALIYPQAILFYLSAVITSGLVAPLILYLRATPAVSLDERGITIYPFLGKAHHLSWDAIEAVKDYPLLPRQNHEVNKRLVIGRKRYKPAEGIMLVTSQLPVIYRVVGFFAGEHRRKVVALTNRTHTDYDRLIKQVMKYTG